MKLTRDESRIIALRARTLKMLLVFKDLIKHCDRIVLLFHIMEEDLIVKENKDTIDKFILSLNRTRREFEKYKRIK